MNNFRQYLLLLCWLMSMTTSAQEESCYERYLREHNKEILPTIDENDDSYDELKKEVIARQVLRGETPYAQYIADRYDQPATKVGVQEQALHRPVILAIDTTTGVCHLLAEDGTVLADVHVALVDSTWYMWLSVDPLADKNPSSTPYMYCNGNPIVRVDPDGRADYYDVDGNHLTNDGVDDNKVFQQNEQGERVLGGYTIPFAEIGTVEKTQLRYNGKMEENNHISTGSLSLIQCVGDKEFTQAVFSAISGSRKKGGGYYHTLPNGEYQSSKYRTRTESVMTRDGVGFSIDLSDVGNRTLLRIHPDGGVRGTQGCIGLNGTAEELQQFVSLVGPLYIKGLNPVVHVNINGNPQYFRP